MTRSVKKMPAPGSFGAGQTAAINMPIGLTYERLYIRATADFGSGQVDVPTASWGTIFDEIRLMVDGDAKITIDAADLVKLNAFYEMPTEAGVLALYLSRPWMRTIGGEDQTGYGTLGLATMSLEIDIKAGANIGALTVSAVQSAGKPFGPHLRIQKYTRNQGVTGPAEIADIVRGNYAMLGMHINTDEITDIEVHTDQRKVLETDKATRAIHNAIAGRSEQLDMTHIDFLSENRLAEAMPMALQDFRLKLDFTAAGNYTIYAESLVGANA